MAAACASIVIYRVPERHLPSLCLYLGGIHPKTISEEVQVVAAPTLIHILSRHLLLLQLHSLSLGTLVEALGNRPLLHKVEPRFCFMGVRGEVGYGDILGRLVFVFEGDEDGAIFEEFGGAVIAELSVAGVADLYVDAGVIKLLLRSFHLHLCSHYR